MSPKLSGSFCLAGLDKGATHMVISTYVSICTVAIYVYRYVCMCSFKSLCGHTGTAICIYVYVRVSVCTFIYTHIYTCMYIYIYVYVHRYAHICGRIFVSMQLSSVTSTDGFPVCKKRDSVWHQPVFVAVPCGIWPLHRAGTTDARKRLHEGLGYGAQEVIRNNCCLDRLGLLGTLKRLNIQQESPGKLGKHLEGLTDSCIVCTRHRNLSNSVRRSQVCGAFAGARGHFAQRFGDGVLEGTMRDSGLKLYVMLMPFNSYEGAVESLAEERDGQQACPLDFASKRKARMTHSKSLFS